MKAKTYKLKAHASQDLEDIAIYSFLNFGIRQAERYRDSILACCEMLADNPYIGTDASYILEGARRHLHKEHIIYYEPTSPITILRILGARQDPLEQLNN